MLTSSEECRAFDDMETVSRKNLERCRDDEWNRFLSIARSMASVGFGPECEAPRLGDLIFCFATVAVQTSIDAYDCSSANYKDRDVPGRDFLSNSIVNDFFTMDTVRFIHKYMSDMTERLDPNERAWLFELKTRLTARVHFDASLSSAPSKKCARNNNSFVTRLTGGNMNDVGGGIVGGYTEDTTMTNDSSRGGDKKRFRAADKSFGLRGGVGVAAEETKWGDCLNKLLRQRLVFSDTNELPRQKDDFSPVRIVEFSPTLALYTWCNLQDEYKSTALGNADRFEVNRDDKYNHHASFASSVTDSNAAVVSSVNNGCAKLDVLGRPPRRKDWLALCDGVSVNQIDAPRQCLVKSCRELIHRDKRINRLVDSLDVSSGDDRNDTIVAASYNRNNATSDRRANDCIIDESVGSGGGGTRRDLGDSHSRSGAVTGGGGIGIQKFENWTEFESEYTDFVLSSSQDGENNGCLYDKFLNLLDGFTVCRAKLYALDCDIFE